MINQEFKNLITSEIADFYAGLSRPGAPENIEEVQRELVRRVLNAIDYWCALRVNAFAAKAKDDQ